MVVVLWHMVVILSLNASTNELDAKWIMCRQNY